MDLSQYIFGENPWRIASKRRLNAEGREGFYLMVSDMAGKNDSYIPSCPKSLLPHVPGEMLIGMQLRHAAFREPGHRHISPSQPPLPNKTATRKGNF